MKEYYINIVCRILLIVAGTTFLYWYISVAFNNVYVCDDYWFGTNVSQYGFWGNQVHYYLNWEGSYTHTFLDSLPHLFDVEKMPFYFNIFSLTLLVFSIYYFIYAFFYSSKIDAFIIGLYVSALFYSFTNGSSEIRYWVSANAYIVELAFVILAITFYHKKKYYNNVVWHTLMGLLLFLIAGSKLTFILYAFAGIVLHDVYLKIKPNKNLYFIIGLLLLFSLVNVFAPGNLIRLQEETSIYKGDIFFVNDILLVRIEKVLPFIVYSLLLCPVSLLLESNLRITKSHIFLFIISIIITFIIDSLIMFICFNDPGPLRIYVLCEMMILLISLCIYSNIKSIFIKQKASWYLLCLIPIIFIICNIPMIKDVTPSIEFARKSKLRDQKVMLTTTDYVELEPLPESYLLLSYFANDIEWIENVYLPYFGKSCTVYIKNPINK
jgi:hypothetical protein